MDHQHRGRGLVSRATGCAYHLGDNSGTTYDRNGKPCELLTAEDKTYILAAAGFCGAVLLGLGLWVGIKHLRRRRRQHQRLSTAEAEAEADMRQIGGGLMRSRSAWMGGHHRHFPSQGGGGGTPLLHPSARSPTISEPSSGLPSPLLAPSSSSSHSHTSPNPSENFHFPILSADGHLLPPAPPSVRTIASPTFSPQLGLGKDRPLPSPPMDDGAFMPTMTTTLPPVSPARSPLPALPVPPRMGGGGGGLPRSTTWREIPQHSEDANLHRQSADYTHTHGRGGSLVGLWPSTGEYDDQYAYGYDSRPQTASADIGDRAEWQRGAAPAPVHAGRAQRPVSHLVAQAMPKLSPGPRYAPVQHRQSVALLARTFSAEGEIMSSR